MNSSNKIEWAPLKIPFHRRLETLSAATWIFTLVIGEFLFLFGYIALLIFGNLYIQTLCILYAIHIFLDRKTPDNGGKGQGYSWMRDSIVWKYYRDYFPIALVKTGDLPPNRNYLFGLYPHGILSSGGFCNFGTNASKFQEYYPGVRSRLVTLNFHFLIPFFRELVYAWGVAAASSNSIKTLLSASNDPKDSKNYDGMTSNAVVIVLGGAQEALNCRPNNYQIVINKRKGFVRIALQTGSPIVPVFSFGEVDLFEQPSNPPGSKLRRFQEWFKSVTGLAPAIFIGRGFFQYSYGLIPKRRPITTVVGTPIDVVKTENPTKEQIDELHGKFVKALNELFETYKYKYVPDPENTKLIME